VTSGVVSLLEHPDFVVQPGQIIRLQRGVAPLALPMTAAETKLAREVVRYHGTSVWGSRPPVLRALGTVAAVAAIGAVVIAAGSSGNQAALREGTVHVELTAPRGRIDYRSGTFDGPPPQATPYRLVLTVTPSRGDSQVINRAIDPASLPVRIDVRVPEGATRFVAELRDGAGRLILSGERSERVQQDRFEVTVPLQQTPPPTR
jgi:hypothetical protein